MPYFLYALDTLRARRRQMNSSTLPNVTYYFELHKIVESLFLPVLPKVGSVALQEVPKARLQKDQY